MPTILTSVPTPHFVGAQAPLGRQEYPVIDNAFQLLLPIKGACIAPATFDKAFKFIVALISINDFQLIVNLFMNLNCEGARAVPILSPSASDRDQAASQNANLQTINNFWQGAMSHFYDVHLRRLIIDSNSEGAQFAPRITASVKAASTFFNVKFKLFVKSASDALHSEGAQTVPTISSIELHGPPPS